jgi:hypothetical protein
MGPFTEKAMLGSGSAVNVAFLSNFSPMGTCSVTAWYSSRYENARGSNHTKQVDP